MSFDREHTVVRFDIVKNRRKFFIFSSAIIIIGFLFMMFQGLHLGVDFKAGTRLDIYVGKEFKPEDVEAVLKQEIPNVAFSKVTPYGQNQAYTRFDQTISSDTLMKTEEALKKKFGDQVTKQVSSVDPSIAQEMVKKAAIAVGIASLGIVIYIAIRFQVLFGIACVVGLLHDVIIPIALFSVFDLEVDITFIAALLTILGYSINDKIVIFDRIRENLRTMKSKTIPDLEHLVNVSLWQTMRRSVYTVATVFFTALAIAVLGSESIRNFSLALLFGLVSGTYSSIFIAAQVWVNLKERNMRKKKEA
ncbi:MULTISPECIES: protein translocase subunit SecF [Brevibacillus]|uniref:Protein-export membrane protein SecF n=1 Tax=Brevibacillus parabrevis TaxID=54914 RepID=A0A4Y3PBL7_BREPA|nr:MULTISPECIES: protein translocase subunit SecF [Brevibacillus]NRQ55565.1 protein translocase subunit SecF [Brevibacillus sp. HD1.4A]MBU8714830.1 protein translocase subunit SecF [Brevibacillus parabrevis]MDH6348793.1 preprotein translocase subunit SecF [Brevibacillus sp. 1238]MDR5000688.1 protein translocase subunit SecF [Brevibacillus parabrevis]MED2253206.1 protein translocase subunit SecF [Brevibacillus parabrevis]